MLSLCKKAGKLILGFDPVIKAMKEQKLVSVMTASDLSENSKKEIDFYCQKLSAPIVQIPLTMNEIWYCAGKRAGIIGITDRGLEDKLRKILIKLNGEANIYNGN